MNYIEKPALSVNGIGWLEKFISFHNGFIAGGCFKNIFSNQSVKDIDIFFRNHIDYDDAVDYCQCHGGSEEQTSKNGKEFQFVYQNDKCICYRHIPSGIKLELISSIFGEPKDILKQFDFTISKYAYYNKKIKFNYEKDSFALFAGKFNPSFGWAWAHTGKARLEAASADAAERVKLRRFISMVLQ